MCVYTDTRAQYTLVLHMLSCLIRSLLLLLAPTRTHLEERACSIFCARQVAVQNVSEIMKINIAKRTSSHVGSSRGESMVFALGASKSMHVSLYTSRALQLHTHGSASVLPFEQVLLTASAFTMHEKALLHKPTETCPKSRVTYCMCACMFACVCMPVCMCHDDRVCVRVCI